MNSADKSRYLRTVLQINERSGLWLARKLRVSHTIVYIWIKGKESIPDRRWNQILKVMDDYNFIKENE